MTDYIRNRSQGTPLWRWCIALALLFLLAETLLIRLSGKTFSNKPKPQTHNA